MSGNKRKIMKEKILALFFLLCSFGVQAQSLQEKYLNAKELFRAGNYGLARESFKSLAAIKVNNPYIQYSSFFYALASYHEGYSAYARDMLLQMKSRDQEWENIDEVNYWLAKINFESGQNDQAIHTIAGIKNREVLQDALDMKIHFLSLMPSDDTLKSLLQRHPSDSIIARVLADRIMEAPLARRDVELLNQLVDQYNLDQEKYEIVAPEKSVRKQEYRVAVMLPFMAREFSNAAVSRKNFVYELFEGIKLAQEELRQEGLDIELYAYDSRKDSIHTKKILAAEEMKGIDLLIGPISSEAIDVVSGFSYANRINMINPVSTNSQIIGRNPYSFLFLPSLETQARQSARFVSEQLGGKKTSIIIYGESYRDSVLAHSYKQAIEDEGFTIALMRKVKKQQERDLFNLFTSTREASPDDPNENPGLLLPTDSIGHIYAATDSDDEMIASYLISAIETRGEYIKVIGHEEWLDFSSIIPEQMERLQVHLVAPTFIDFSSPEYKNFRNKYLSSTYTLPSKFAGIGYDLMKFAGTMLREEGIYFQVRFEEMGFRKGFVLPGYLYDHSQDNQYVPMIRFIDSGLINVNPSQDQSRGKVAK